MVGCLLLPTWACMCPTCQQPDKVDRCMCCVYRQLGKRSGTGTDVREPGASLALTATALRESPLSAVFRETPMPAAGLHETPLSASMRESPILQSGLPEFLGTRTTGSLSGYGSIGFDIQDRYLQSLKTWAQEQARRQKEEDLLKVSKLAQLLGDKL